LLDFIKKNLLFAGLILVFLATMLDTTGTIAGLGKWLKNHHGPNAAITLIFFLSALTLETGQIASGLKDIKGLLVAFTLIFIVSPVLAALFAFLPLDPGIIIGLFLVAVMPTTLSSGVVMTEAAGGSMTHALLISISANMASVATIPLILPALLSLTGQSTDVVIDQWSVMADLGLFVLAPLCAGLLFKSRLGARKNRLLINPQVFNQFLILAMVWMGASQSRQTILGNQSAIILILVLVFTFHLTLLAAGWLAAKTCRLGRGRRESVILMGAQKTLPLSVILQVSLFPQYGLALVVCVVHHIVHLLMDSYILRKLRAD